MKTRILVRMPKKKRASKKKAKKRAATGGVRDQRRAYAIDWVVCRTCGKRYPKGERCPRCKGKGAMMPA